jgi:flagellar protein FliO/FliZ
MSSSTGLPLLWFVAIVAAIPAVLWLLKRSGRFGAAGAAGAMRNIAALPLSPSQRLVTVEVGTGEERRWLVLGVTPQSITTLHTMAPQDTALQPPAAPADPFAQLLAKLQPRRDAKGGDGAR